MNLGVAPDRVGNPLTVSDASTAAWPNGAKPANARYTYDDNYRLLTVDSTVSADSWTSPYQHESSQGSLSPYALPIQEPTRVSSQTYSYDLRGNMCSWTDPASDLDRSFGSAWYYNSGGGARSPSSATVVGPRFDQVGITNYPIPNSGGYITTDSRGDVYVFYNFHGGISSPDRTYIYYWDEVGRLNAAVHGKASNQVASEVYAYDSDGNRVRQDNSTYINGISSPAQSTFQIFDMLVVKNATYNWSTSTWSAPTAGNTHVYVGGGMAHMFYDGSGALPRIGSNLMHTFLRFDDHRKSNAIVVDHDSGEVVERTAYQAYGALDADYRPTRWNSNREDYKQTGNWDNAEVGLVYMNNRYYSPQLGRFISPDPVTIHGLAGDPNPYEYAHGNPMRYGDPTGLWYIALGATAGASAGFGAGASASGSVSIWIGSSGFGLNANGSANVGTGLGASAGVQAGVTAFNQSANAPSGVTVNVWTGSVSVDSSSGETASASVGVASGSVSSDGTVSVVFGPRGPASLNITAPEPTGGSENSDNGAEEGPGFGTGGASASASGSEGSGAGGSEGAAGGAGSSPGGGDSSGGGGYTGNSSGGGYSGYSGGDGWSSGPGGY
jgi:RHS repeat-associated protein